MLNKTSNITECFDSCLTAGLFQERDGENHFKCVSSCSDNLIFVEGDNTCVSECPSGVYESVNVSLNTSGKISLAKQYKCADPCPGNYTKGRNVGRQHYVCVNGCGKDQLLVVSGNAEYGECISDTICPDDHPYLEDRRKCVTVCRSLTFVVVSEKNGNVETMKKVCVPECNASYPRSERAGK